MQTQMTQMWPIYNFTRLAHRLLNRFKLPGQSEFVTWNLRPETPGKKTKPRKNIKSAFKTNSDFTEGNNEDLFYFELIKSNL